MARKKPGNQIISITEAPNHKSLNPIEEHQLRQRLILNALENPKPPTTKKPKPRKPK